MSKWLDQIYEEIGDGLLDDIEIKGWGDYPVFQSDVNYGLGLTGNQKINTAYSPLGSIGYFVSWAYAATMLVAEKWASTPLHLYLVDKPDKVKTVKTKSRKNLRLKSMKFGDPDDYEEIIDKNPITDLLSRPNPLQTGYEYAVDKAVQLQLFGNCYEYIMTEKVGKKSIPVARFILPFPYVEPIYTKELIKLGQNPVIKYKYRIGTRTVELDPKDINHYRLPGRAENTYMGMGRMEAAFTALMIRQGKRDMDISKAFRATYPSMVFALKGATQHSIERFEAEMGRKLVGAQKTGKILAVNADDIRLTQLDIPQFELGDPQVIIDEIAATWRVPNDLLQIKSSTMASATVAQDLFLTTTINPLLRLDEEQLNELYIPRFSGKDPKDDDYRDSDVFLEYDTYIVREIEAFDRKDRREEVISLKSAGIISVNEAREELDYPPMKEEELVVQASSVQDLDREVRQVRKQEKEEPISAKPNPEEDKKKDITETEENKQ